MIGTSEDTGWNMLYVVLMEVCSRMTMGRLLPVRLNIAVNRIADGAMSNKKYTITLNTTSNTPPFKSPSQKKGKCHKAQKTARLLKTPAADQEIEEREQHI